MSLHAFNKWNAHIMEEKKNCEIHIMMLLKKKERSTRYDHKKQQEKNHKRHERSLIYKLQWCTQDYEIFFKTLSKICLNFQWNFSIIDKFQLIHSH